MENALIWRDGNRAVAALMDRFPRRLIWRGVSYHPKQRYFSDVDYLQDSGGSLVGFSFYVNGTEEELEDALFKSANVIRDHLAAQIVLKETEERLIETVQAVGTQIYESALHGIIVAVSDWGFGKIGFTWQHIHPVEDQ